MKSFEFSNSLIKINELIEKGLIIEAELLLYRVGQKLNEENTQEELKRFEVFKDKVEDKVEELKLDHLRNGLDEKSIQTLLGALISENKQQNKTLSKIEAYFKLFYVLTIIGLVILVLILIFG
jgi:6-phosphogluconate dehydrogenase